MEVKYKGEAFTVVKPEKDYTWLKPKTDEGFTKGDIIVIPTKTLNENENVPSVTIGVKWSTILAWLIIMSILGLLIWEIVIVPYTTLGINGVGVSLLQVIVFVIVWVLFFKVLKWCINKI